MVGSAPTPKADEEMTKKSQVLTAHASLDATLKKLRRRPKAGKPVPAEALAALEAHWKRPLPPSYRELLEHHDGYADRASDPTVIGLLPAKSLLAKSGLAREAAEWKTADPDCAEAIRGLVIGRTLDAWTLFDPAVASGAEPSVVTIDSDMEITRYPSLEAYLRAGEELAKKEAESNAFAKASSVRSKELEAQGASIQAALSLVATPDGSLLAAMAVREIVFFDPARAVIKDGAKYAPVVRTIATPTTTNWQTEKLAFAAGGTLVVRTCDQGTFAYDVATGEARPAPTALDSPPAKLPFTPSNRFRMTDGLRLNPAR